MTTNPPTESPQDEFPVDNTTLALLEAACNINPDTGRTHLMDFLSMGEEVKSRTLLMEEGDLGLGIVAPVYEVEFEEGREPWSVNSVILALVAEVRRLRESS
jgi:hypothetical protein